MATFTEIHTYYAIQCSIIKTIHPEYSWIRVHWEASKEMVHLALDGLGLVPGAGEIADLTNGLIYTFEGRGTEATLSYASAIPIVGWFTAGAKFAIRTVNISGTTTKIVLKWTRAAGDVIQFGDRSQLRKVLGLAVGDARQAHHILPWGKQAHPAIQKATKGADPFHMNQALNGIPLNNSVHLGSHAAYDNRVIARLNSIDPNLTPAQTKSAVEALINSIRQQILSHPNTHVNDLIF